MSMSEQAQAPELKSYGVTLEIEVTAETKLRAMEMVAKALRDAVRDPEQLAQVLISVQEQKLGTGVEPVPTGLVADGPPELN